MAVPDKPIYRLATNEQALVTIQASDIGAGDTVESDPVLEGLRQHAVETGLQQRVLDLAIGVGLAILE